MGAQTAFLFGIFFGVFGTLAVVYLMTHDEARAALFGKIKGLFKKGE